jgi:hypothetical protein
MPQLHESIRFRLCFGSLGLAEIDQTQFETDQQCNADFTPASVLPLLGGTRKANTESTKLFLELILHSTQ